MTTRDAYNAGWTHGVESARAGRPNIIPSAPPILTGADERDLWQSGWADGWGATYWHEIAD